MRRPLFASFAILLLCRRPVFLFCLTCHERWASNVYHGHDVDKIKIAGCSSDKRPNMSQRNHAVRKVGRYQMYGSIQISFSSQKDSSSVVLIQRASHRAHGWTQPVQRQTHRKKKGIQFSSQNEHQTEERRIYSPAAITTAIANAKQHQLKTTHQDTLCSKSILSDQAPETVGVN